LTLQQTAWMAWVVIRKETTRRRKQEPAKLYLVPRPESVHRGPGDTWAFLVLLFCLAFLAG
jgi:hypothetical protein